MKILEINYCTECPHFKAKARCNESDRFDCICTNPQLIEVKQWDNRIGRDVNIPSFCPLDDKEYQNILN